MDSTQFNTKEVKTCMKTRANVRKMTVTAMLSAVAFVLMFLDTAVPFMPSL